MLSFESRGDFKKTSKFLEFISEGHIYRRLDELAAKGTRALEQATPLETGAAANAWSHKVEVSRNGAKIEWFNSDMAGGAPTVILLQYGHGTGTGGYVVGRDFINPALKPIFDEIADKVWKAVTSA